MSCLSVQADPDQVCQRVNEQEPGAAFSLIGCILRGEQEAD